ncbi:hypothetical protein PLESTB_001756000 [Pleodorina starrii]|uniref:Uncharacterized protein n=1 Tax=Pleodorina starrii TaxID=330485 RepID=A0A9W6C042_9CHLO|nr:hypothetical protein PLESTB_001756000 [Pleodorina starrii]
MGFQPSSKSQVQPKPGQRLAFGDLTNALKRTSSLAPAKPAQPSARTVPDPPIEHMAGKGLKVLEKELLQQEEAHLQRRLDRVAAAASTWTASHLYHEEELSSDDESESNVSLSEPFPESPIVVQLRATRRGQGVAVPQPGPGFDNDLYNLLPDVPPVLIDFDQCWADEEA